MPGVAAAAWTVASVVDGDWRPGLVWLAALAAAAIAEALPVPIEGVGPSTTSLATVFIAAAAAELGPQASASIAALAMLIGHAHRRSEPVRRLYNVSLYCTAGAAAGLVSVALPSGWRFGGAEAAAFYVTDVGLLSLVIAASSAAPWPRTAGTLFKTTLLPFVAMGCLTIVLVALWRDGLVVLALGPPVALVIVLQRREASIRRKQRELDQAKDDFLATTSHELRTPLASVYGAAQTLDQRTNLTEKTRTQLLKVVATESTRLAKLVEDVLWAARLGSRRGVEGQSDTCFPELAIEDVLAAEDAAGFSGRIRRGPITETPCRADPEHLRRILTNLVDNALRYSPGSVEVAAQNGDGLVQFTVDDEGAGIPSHDRERIFDRFVRLDPAMSQAPGGTGLGLYICRELAQGMGGDVSIEDSPRGGARFVLQLPAADD